ncbi:hypothetical protein RUND412_001647 [Rhizina undulata]
MTYRHKLSWSASSIPQPPPLPNGVERGFIESPDGRLELLVAAPANLGGGEEKPVLLFVHGGFGTASCFLNFLPYFSSRSYPSYSLSLRGHGLSHNPGFWRMNWTSKHTFATDIAFAISYIRTIPSSLGREIILIGHSTGAGLAQYLADKELETVNGIVMLAGDPGFGSYDVYWRWLKLDPYFPLRMSFLHFYHPRSPFSSTNLVHQAFFSPEYPQDQVIAVEKSMPEFESSLLVLEMAFKFVDPGRVIKGIRTESRRKMLVVAGGEDMLVGVAVPQKLVEWFRAPGQAGEQGEQEEAVKFGVVEGSGHHLMLDLQWEACAGVVVEWLEGR